MSLCQQNKSETVGLIAFVFFFVFFFVLNNDIYVLCFLKTGVRS